MLLRLLTLVVMMVLQMWRLLLLLCRWKVVRFVSMWRLVVVRKHVVLFSRQASAVTSVLGC